MFISMTTEVAFPELIAQRAGEAVRSLVIPEPDDARTAIVLSELVQRSVLIAFGCTCEQHTEEPQETFAVDASCPLHGSNTRPASGIDQAVMGSPVSWEDDPYDGYTSAERREGVQGTIRTASEFLRAFRSEFAGTVSRGRTAEDQMIRAIEHAQLSGGLTRDELKTAETALAAVQYALQLLYVAGNHVGDPAVSDHYL
ncbi:hypothetical protein [Micromonospora profundi]|uniref:hypothetical protein n=1 Tax=Micromonospora profundi TaxID=1420889 RepID=UPI003665CDF1